MIKAKIFPAEGGCTCRAIRYLMISRPLFVHCCHCTWCQRESGAAFALNAMIEANRIKLFNGEPETVKISSNSGKGQKIVRCSRCRIAVWSHYAGAGLKVAFVRVGTLDRPDHCPPDIHIFTASKQKWIVIPPDAHAMHGYYKADKYWPAASLKRRAAMMGSKHD